MDYIKTPLPVSLTNEQIWVELHSDDLIGDQQSRTQINSVQGTEPGVKHTVSARP